MALPVREQFKYWGVAALAIAVVLWFLGDVLLPFVLGGAVAYLLDPVADRLERAGLSRAAAVAVITVLALVIFVLLSLLVIPTLVKQAAELIEIAPQLFGQPARLSRRPLPRSGRFRIRDPAIAGLGRRAGAGIWRQAARDAAQLGGLDHQCGAALRDRAGGLGLPAARLGPDGRQDRPAAAARPCAHHPAAGARHRPHAGQFHPRHGHGLPDPRHLLRGGADAGGPGTSAWPWASSPGWSPSSPTSAR